MLSPILVLALGAIALYVGFTITAGNRRCAGWPSTSGQVLERSVAAAPSVGRGRNFEPKVKYSYSVDGKGYTSEQVYCVGKPLGLESDMQKLVDGLGASPTVFYNPQDPSEAFLLRTSTGFAWLAFVCGGLLALVGLGMIAVRLLNRE